MLSLRQSETRGLAEHGWLRSKHSFSFASYHDPAHMQFSSLRVINEDWISARRGFDTHPHQNMEILTYLISGALEHRDSLGNGEVMYPGDVQVMSAGRGVRHSEYSASDQTTHLLQIWIVPASPGGEPSYRQKNFSADMKKNRLCLLAAPRENPDDALPIGQDAYVYASLLGSGQTLLHRFESSRCGYLQLISGELQIDDLHLKTGDGLKITQQNELNMVANSDAEFLLFDLMNQEARHA